MTLLDEKYGGNPQGPVPAGSGSDCPAAFQYQLADRGTTFKSNDGSGMVFIANQDIYDANADEWTTNPPSIPAGTLYFRDGTHYVIDNQGRVAAIQDRNGNTVTLNYSYDSAYNETISIVDSIGRHISAFVPNNWGTTNPDMITYAGFDGEPRQITVNHANLDATIQSGTVLTFQQLFPELNGDDSSTYDPIRVSSIVLADVQAPTHCAITPTEK